MSAFRLHIDGEPRGKGRPRFARGRTYTPPETVAAENAIRDEWQAAGRPHVEGPLRVDMVLSVVRPKSHLRADGSLTPLGAKTPRPMRKPDVDNALKLIDSLNGLAYHDDVQVVEAFVRRVWARAPSTDILVRELQRAA